MDAMVTPLALLNFVTSFDTSHQQCMPIAGAAGVWHSGNVTSSVKIIKQ